MRAGWIRAGLVVLVLGAGGPDLAPARADDRDLLTAFLEDNLSGAGRVVTVTGFEGALSSQARIAALTIADDQGVWLTLKGVTLDWDRAALFSRSLDVTKLAAEEIDLDRLPQSRTQTALPSPAARSFALPDLPVSIAVQEIAADRLILGAGVLGERVEGRIRADAALSGGQGHLRLELARTDGATGRLSLVAGYANATGILSLALDAKEDAGGLAVKALGIPGAPAARLVLGGTGPLEAFSASLRLDTDGLTRLQGRLTLEDAAGQGTRFAGDLGGDLAPLFAPDYAAFFGDGLQVHVQGLHGHDGALTLEQIALTSRALSLTGSMALGADGLPRKIDLAGRLADPQGGPVLLPLPGPATRVGTATLSLAYDRDRGEAWQGRIEADGFERPGLSAQRLALEGTGRLRTGPGQDGTPEGQADLTADLAFAVTGLASSPALDLALGRDISGKARMDWRQGSGKLALSDLTLAAGDLRLTMSGAMDTALTLDGRLDLQAADLSRLAGLAGRPLSGAGALSASGQFNPLTGAFDGLVALDARDLRTELAEVDGLLAGSSHLEISARRDQTGTTLRDLRLATDALAANLAGRITGSGVDLAGKARLDDLTGVRPGLGGSLAAELRLTGPMDDLRAEVTARSADLAVGQPQADAVLRGEGRLTARFGFAQGKIRIDALDFATPEASLTAQGAAEDLAIQGRLANLGRILPELPGALNVKGRVRQTAAGLGLDLAMTGPGRIDARLQGQLSADFRTAELTARGSAQAGLANALLAPRVAAGEVDFDLSLKGPLALSSLSGTARLSQGRLADPDQPFGLTGIEARVALAGGAAEVQASGRLTSGGGVTVGGRIGLSPEMPAALAISLQDAVLRDPALFTATLGGTLSVDGPLAGGAQIAGAIALKRTELRIPTASVGSVPVLTGLRHQGDVAPVRATRQRAGLEGADRRQARRGAAFGLDLVVTAPDQVFVRGRGLDAELGGQVRLGGTTEAIVPSGSLSLIRGRMDLLGKRLTLTEASLQMQGALVPYLKIAATTDSAGFAITVQIEGDATDPEVRFASQPELPQEEVLARLLFDRGLENLSPFQAAELASAVATLAGKGGEGLVGRLRRTAGLDNLDVQADGSGTTKVTAGKYLSKKLYTEVTVDPTGQSTVNLNLDISRHITLRGRLEETGQTGIGIYLERDY